MPYVNDSSAETPMGVIKRVSRTGVILSQQPMAISRRTRSQRGWRSVGEYEAAYADMLATQTKFTTWGQSKQVIQAMERVERALTNPLIRGRELPVHDRDYSESFQSNLIGSIIPLPTTGSGGYSIPAAELSISGTPTLGKFTEGEIRARGNKMIRNSRPTKPHSNLGQWFGELRDANRLGSLNDSMSSFSSAYSIPRNIGGAYLNWQFGWNGFVGDLKAACEALLHAEDLINQFLEDSTKLHYRKRAEILSQGAYQTSGILSSNNYNFRRTSFNSPVIGASVGVNTMFGETVSRSHWRASISWTEQLRTFAVFEFFVYDPNGAVNRIRRASQFARKLLGEPLLSASTIYELHPWTWLGDWFVDVGGLLAFQESVASDSTVARRCGTVYEYEINGHLHVDIRATIDPNSTLKGQLETFSERKFQRRRPGNPYDLSVDWSHLTPKQWTILGALGLTRAPRVGIG